MRKLYAGCDLHSNSNFWGIGDERGEKVFHKKLPNDLALMLAMLEPFREELVGIVVESTYNWYWMADGLMEKGYQVHLANTSAIQQYEGLKHADDKHDAFHLAELQRAQLRVQANVEEAKALARHPELIRLRELQALEKMAESGARFVIGLGGETLTGLRGEKTE